MNFTSHHPRKRFGQNFLHEPNTIRRIVDHIAPQPDDPLVEIGPGEGALTRPLLARLKQLDVIELDRDLVPRLQAELGADGRLRIHQADALRFDFTALARARGVNRLRVVGNLPYNISSPLLFHLLEQQSAILDLHVMLQLEVADRIVATPGGKEYGRLSVAIAARAEAEILFRVAPGAFRPPPKVQSAVLRITPRPPSFPVRDWRAFDRVLIAAFSQRRKTLANSLRALVNAEQLRTLDVDPSRRAETLAAEQFARIANFVAETGA